MSLNYCQLFALNENITRTVKELKDFIIQEGLSKELTLSMLQDLVKDKNKLTLVDENNNSVLTDDQSVSTLIDNLFSETNIILSDLEKNVLKIEDANNENGENNEDENFISQELLVNRQNVFGKNNMLINYNKSLFRLLFIPKIFVFYKQTRNSKEYFIVTSNKDLNESIINYKTELFNIIVNYVKAAGLLNEDVEPLYISESTKKFTYRYANKIFYEKVMRLMLKRIEQNSTELSELLKDLWLNWVNDESSNNYNTLVAFNAYVTLSNFDEILKEECDGLINIDPNYNGVLENPETSTGKSILKYKLGEDASHAVKDWNTSEYRDALKESSKLSKLILSSVLVKFNGRMSNVQLELKDVINAFSNLIMSLEASNSLDPDVKNHLNNLYKDPLIHIPKLIQKVKTKLGLDLQTHFLTPYDRNILISLYDGLLDSTKNQKTLHQVERLWLRSNKGSLTLLILNEVVVGLLNRTNGVNYNQTTYSSENGYETKTLNKATNINKRVHDYKDSRNNFIKYTSNLEYQRLTDKRIKVNSGISSRSILLSINGNFYEFDFMKVTRNQNQVINFLADIAGIDIRQLNTGLNILEVIKTEIDSKLTNSSLINHTAIKKLFKQIQTYRNTKQSENDNIKILSDILQFIDDMLALGLDSDLGYETLHNYLAKGYTVKELFQAALRTAYGLHLQHEYNKYVDTTPENETVESLSKWLEKQGISRELLKKVSTLRKNTTGDEIIVAIAPSQQWLDAWFLSEADITGANSKATTTNVEGNKMANFRQGSLATRLKHLVLKILNEPNSAATHLLFCHGSNIDMIKEIAYDLDLLSNQGVKKPVKNANQGETVYNSIMHHFLNSLLNDHILIQPTVYADKTSFVLYKLSSNFTIKVNGKQYSIFGKKGSDVLTLNRENCISLYKETVGKYFKDSILDTKKRWVALLNLSENKELLGLDDSLNVDTVSLVELNKILNRISKNTLTTLVRNYQYTSESENLPIKPSDFKIIKNTDYCIINGHLALNLELCYYDSILFEGNELDKVYKSEERLFLQLLLDLNLNFYTYELHDSKTSDSNSILSKVLKMNTDKFSQLFEIDKDSFTKNWIKSGKLILGKYKILDIDNNVKIVELKNGDKIPENVDIEMNPILLKYFYIESLFGNNLKYSLTGSELIHDDKSGIKLSKELSLFENEIRTAINNPNFKVSDISDMTQLFELVDQIKSLDPVLYTQLISLYKDITRRRIASCELAQDKRNSMIPATLDHLTQGSIVGMPVRAKVAAIGDPKASVFNVNGEQTDIEAQDGSGVVDPFTVNLENGGLADKAVSYSTRKFITHDYDPKTGQVYFAKYALFTNSNSNIRLSYKSDLSGYNLKKKMTNLRWNGRYNLLNLRYINDNLTLNFTRDILNTVTGRELYYLDLDTSYEISNLVYKNGIYYTVERKYNIFGKSSKSSYVALLFTHESNIYRIRQRDGETDEAFFERVNKIKLERNLHTIDSLFELWESMGGAYSLLLDDNEFLEFSENSNKAVTAFMNNVFSEPTDFDKYVDEHLSKNNKESLSNEERKTLLKEYIEKVAKDFPLSLTYFEQPLKSELISYCLNPTALKSYLANVNPSEEWISKPQFSEKGMQGLLYFTINTDTHGPQLDPYHEADEADMAEPTLVIASLDAGGATHWMAREAFKDLSKISADKLLKEAKILEDFLVKYSDIKDRDLILSELYDIFARSFINYYSPKKSYDLCSVIVDSVKERFNLSSNEHTEDLKLPISDPNIFSLIMSTFITKINTAIKRRSSGLGTIMVPGYNKGQLWHLIDANGDSLPMLAEDIYEEATNEGNVKKLLNDFELLYLEEEEVVVFNVSKTDLTNLQQKLFELSLILKFPEETKWKFKDESEFHTIEYVDENTKRSQLIDVYLKDKLYQLTDNGEYLYAKTLGQISPTDIVDVHVNEINDDKKITFDLLDLDAYYMFKKGHWAYFHDLENGNIIRNKYYDKIAKLAKLNGIPILRIDEFFKNKANLMKAYTDYAENMLEYSLVADSSKYLDLYDKPLFYINNVIKPRNLAPLKVYWKYNKTSECNLYDIDVVYNEYLNSHVKRDTARQKKIDDAFRDISENGKFLLNGITYIIDEGSLTNEAAELLMSNIYASKFGLGNKSLYQILKHFDVEEIDSINKSFGQFSLVTSKNTHIFIDVNADKTRFNATSNEYKELSWGDNLKYHKSDDDRYLFIDYTFEDGNTLEIGRRIDVSNIYKVEGNKIYKVDEQGNREYLDNTSKKNLNLFIVKGKVWQNIYFVKKFELNNENIFDGTYSKSIGYAFDYNTIKDIYTTFNKTEEKDPKIINEQLENGISKYIGQTIYKIYDLNDCSRFLLLDSLKVSNLKHVLRVITNIGIKEDNYNKFDAANDLNLFLELKIITQKTLLALIDDTTIQSKKSIKLSETLILYDKNKNETKRYIDALNEMQEEIKYVKKSSFELSRYFTAARIPAQTLLSYMLMKLVGYIPGNGNECMVSHWLTWLLGSDYDIDKAYIMGYQFSSSGKFIHWSPLFDFSSKETLRASTLLPTPSKIAISTDSSKKFTWANKVLHLDPSNSENDFSNLVNLINNLSELIKNEQNLKIKNNLKSRKLALVSRLISEIDNVQGNIINLGSDYEQVVELINTHEQHRIPKNIRESATLNSVSSRIQHIVGDVANIPLATSPIQMEGVRKPANNSPKQGTISKYTGINPITKYIILELNMVGKKVIGIAAVGEKVFMGLTYYFNECVRLNNEEWIQRAKFYLEYYRILNRSTGRPVFQPKTTIADTNLWGLNEDEIREKFYQVSQIHEKVYRYYHEQSKSELEYEDWMKIIKNDPLFATIKLTIEDVIKNSGSLRVQADLMISLLLSAATDNAKELILDRINSGTSMAKMYIHLIILGFSIDDIAEFMISGAVSTIDKFTKVNMFDEYINEFSVDKAVLKAKGYVQASKYLQGSVYNVEQLRNQFITSIVLSDIRSVLEKMKDQNPELYNKIIEFSKNDFDQKSDAYKKGEYYKLVKVQHFVNYAVDSAIDGNTTALTLLSNLFKKSDSKVGRSVNALLDEMYYVSKTIRETIQNRYNGNRDEYIKDIDEFAKIYDLSSETSLLGTAFFGLNKGLSTKTEDILNLINKYEKLVSDHEIKFGINSELSNIDAIIDVIIAAKPYLNEDKNSIKEDKDSIRNTLLKALAAGIINNFNGTDYILNTDVNININGQVMTVKYRDVAAEYYDLIKDQYNVFDIMQRSPLYLEALNAFRIALGYIERLSIKFTVLNTMRRELSSIGVYIDDKVIRKLTRYAEKLVLVNWIESASSRFNLKFPIRKDDEVYSYLMDVYKSTDTKLQSLDTFQDRANFKRFIETILIPSIRKGEFKYDGNTYTFTNNKFINSLIDGIENNQPLKKLNMLMNEIESSVYNMKQFQEIMDDLMKLNSEEYKIGDLTIADYFVLYGLMTSLNRYGNDRLTAIFLPLITLSESKIYKDYLKFIGLQDLNLLFLTHDEKVEKLYKLGFDKYDVLEEIAPLYSTNTERNAKEEVIKVRNSSGEILWKRKIRGIYTEYKYMPEVLDTPVSSLKKKRYNNIVKDGLLILVHRDSHNVIEDSLLSDNLEAIKEALSGLINKSKLSLDYKCE